MPEIFAGNAVAIGVYSDYATPEMTTEEKREYLRKLLLEDRPDDVTDEELEYYLDIRVGEIDKADLSSEELRNLIRFRLRINYMPEDFYDVDSLDHDMLAMVFDSSYFGLSVEEIEVYENREPYMVFVGKDPAIYAQYVCDELTSNHAVTLVGWDDSFPAENWPEGRRPPADGAWIAKNSWGRDWGNDGFFLLSYYDKTICGLHSFDYIVDYQESNQESLKVLAHDIMPATILNETSFDKPVYGASVFTVDEDCCLQYVSAITGTLKNTLTACIYLLDEDATDPTRG